VRDLAEGLVGDVVRGEAEAVDAEEDVVGREMVRLWRADEHGRVRVEAGRDAGRAESQVVVSHVASEVVGKKEEEMTGGKRTGGRGPCWSGE
jgi:hypothetical protein